MFDVNFSELLLIGIVALVVIGPERLPKVARTMGLLFGRVQRYTAEIKADINNQLKLDELRKIEAEMRAKAQSAEHVIIEETQHAQQELKAAAEMAVPSPGAEAENTAAQPEAASPPVDESPAAQSPQLELGLDTAANPRTESHA
ncbi:MAG: Sec-independent protein translocase protein TatB [Sulfuricella sp.]|nr:Sec-independent protein translocase protein TatB [Gammaproteobacteria bacterium]